MLQNQTKKRFTKESLNKFSSDEYAMLGAEGYLFSGSLKVFAHLFYK